MESQSTDRSRRMRVFLCHSSGDKERVRDLYGRLKKDGFLPWLDEIDLTPGVMWRDAIDQAVRTTDAIVVCLSRASVNKEGFLQKELRIAIDVADEKPEGAIFLIPVRFEEVEVPRRLRDLQWANLYDADGYDRLLRALRERGQRLPLLTNSQPSAGSTLPPTAPSPLQTAPPSLRNRSRFLLFLAIALVLIGIAIVIGSQYQRLRQRTQADVKAKMSAAIDNLKAFNVTEAQALLREAVSADPDNALAHADLAIAFAQGGNYTAARSHAQTGLALSRSLPENDRLWVEGVSQEVTWHLHEAESSYRKAWAEYQNTEAALRLAHVATLSLNPTESLQVLTALESSADVASDPRIDYERAQAADAQNNLDDELTTLKQIRKNHSTESIIVGVALSWECWVYYRQGKLTNADEACQDAMTRFDNAGDRLGRARVFTRQSLIVAAGHAISSDPRKSAIDLQNAALDIARPLGSELDEAGALQNRSNLLMNSGETEAARKDYEVARTIYKDMGNQLGLNALENNWAVSLVNSCHYEEARATFESVAESTSDPQGFAEVTSNVGSMDYFLGNLVNSEAELTTALQKTNFNGKGLNPDWLTTLGDVQMAQNKLDAAEACFRGVLCTNNPLPSDWSQHAVLPDATLEYALLQVEKHNAVSAERIGRKRMAEAHGQDPEDEANAIDVVARSLLARDADMNARRSINDKIIGIEKKVKSCWLAVSLAITASRISASLGHVSLAKQQISDALADAGKGKLEGYKLEALLAQAQLEMGDEKNETVVEQVSQVKQTADAKGFKLISQKAAALSVKFGVKAARN